MIDSHCHLDVAAFDDDRDDVVGRAAAAGVVGMVVPAIRPRSWQSLIAFARRHAGAGVRHAIGIHPQIVPELGDDEWRDVEQQLTAAAIASAAIAIGECGLDGATGERDRQIALLRVHIRVARALGLPLVLHVLRAHDIAPGILREERCGGGVLHSYSGSADLVPIYRDLGLAFSFAGPISYPNANKPVAALRAVPRDLLLVETDAPDQRAAGTPGQAVDNRRNEPALLPSIIAAAASHLATTFDDIAQLTASNARRLFASW